MNSEKCKHVHEAGSDDDEEEDDDETASGKDVPSAGVHR